MPVRSTVGVPIHPRAPVAPSTILPVPYFKQEQSNWCWAGCSEMLYHFFGITNIRQCDMASAQFGAACCANPGSSVCNQHNWPETTLLRVGIRSTRMNGMLNAIAIQGELTAGRAMMVYYSWTGGGAHVAVLRGAYTNGDLDVHDPWYGAGRRSYGLVASGYGLGQWAMSYSGIRI